MVAPALVVIAGVAFYPVGYSIYLSLFNMHLQFPQLTHFLELRNYIHLFSGSEFWLALRNTIFCTAVSILLETALGLCFALLMHKRSPIQGVLRAAILVPWAIPAVVSSQAWRLMFNDSEGVINDLLTRLHLLPHYIAWLGQPGTAMVAIITTDVWKTTPFMALLLLAGLQMIPEDLNEAAAVEGASPWKRFWRITFPLLQPTLVVALIFRTLDAVRVFDVINIMTGGGPANQTESLSIFAYKYLFNQLNMGFGSAIAVLTFLLVFLISLI
ncbi:MAG: sugar ABC transporter permease [Firmicutes bacterium]|nr:sugar ABC transporter permease [Bacillota bacterium]